MKDEPLWSDLPSETPASVRRLLRRCLTKTSHDRLQAIGDARIELGESLAGAGGSSVSGDGEAASVRKKPRAPAIAAALLAAVAGSTLTWWVTSSRDSGDEDLTPIAGTAIRTTLELPEDASLALGMTFDLGLLALSPTGASWCT